MKSGHVSLEDQSQPTTVSSPDEEKKESFCCSTTCSVDRYELLAIALTLVPPSVRPNPWPGTLNSDLGDNIIQFTNREMFPNFTLTARSLPLHCIVESVSTLQSVIGHGSSGGSGGNGSGGGGSGGGSGGSSSAENRGQWKRRSNIETDSYIIVPAVTQFCNIVPTALQRLGYSPEIGHYAKGE